MIGYNTKLNIKKRDCHDCDCHDYYNTIKSYSDIIR